MYGSCLSTIPLTHVHLKTDPNLIPFYSTETRLIFFPHITSLHYYGVHVISGHMVVQVGLDTSQTRSHAVHTQQSYFPGAPGTKQVRQFPKCHHKDLKQ